MLGIGGIAGAKLVAAEVARICFGRFGYLFVSLAIFLSAMGFLNATIMQVPRAYYAMAEDKVLPSIFKKVNQRTQAQEFTLFFVGTILLSLVFLGTFESIVNYVMFIDSLNIAIVSSTIFVLRRKARLQKVEYKGYRVPFYPVLPAIFVLFLLAISINVLLSEPRPALFGTIIFISGYPIFLLMRGVSKKRAPF